MKRRRARLAAVLIAFLAAAVAGCGREDRPSFRLNLEGRDPAKVSLAQREELETKLASLFGDPNEPRVPEGVSLNVALLKQAAGPIGSDEQGRVWGLFRKHCVACHGVSGDGAGPSASLFDPYPRDYRNGVFKYTSTTTGAKPTRDDLRRTLARGLPGTAMPSFAAIPEAQREALIEYVVYLSLRGQTERSLIAQVVDADDYPVNVDTVIEDYVRPAAESWSRAKDERIPVPPAPELRDAAARAASIARGGELFRSAAAQCYLCHGKDGRGIGEQTELYDDWNRPKKGTTPEQTRQRARFFTLPLQRLRPRDLTAGVFHGGDRPEDLYDRVFAGIKGTPMPPGGPNAGNLGAIAPDDLWNVVNFVRSLSDRGR